MTTENLTPDNLSPTQYKSFWIHKAAAMVGAMPTTMALQLRNYMAKHRIGACQASMLIYDYYLAFGEWPPESVAPDSFEVALSATEIALRKDFAHLEDEYVEPSPSRRPNRWQKEPRRSRPI